MYPTFVCKHGHKHLSVQAVKNCNASPSVFVCKRGHKHTTALARQHCNSRLTRAQIADASKMHANTRVEEASTLGLAPGYWPSTLTYDGITWEQTSDQRAPNGDVVSVTYVSSADGYTKLEVLND